MRVIECNLCGELVSAATDDELATGLIRHHGERHEGSGLDDAEASQLVADEAYEASDS
ncbi:MAG: hypothetical protein QOI98_241 [Solirubrobacteraceae bacterium]|jgi:hypothetical protein|nr:hypothetical protein [Solirubrobacteraceae bacterium]